MSLHHRELDKIISRMTCENDDVWGIYMGTTLREREERKDVLANIVVTIKNISLFSRT